MLFNPTSILFFLPVVLIGRVLAGRRWNVFQYLRGIFRLTDLKAVGPATLIVGAAILGIDMPRIAPATTRYS